jgi:hypothetical protein
MMNKQGMNVTVMSPEERMAQIVKATEELDKEPADLEDDELEDVLDDADLDAELEAVEEQAEPEPIAYDYAPDHIKSELVTGVEYPTDKTTYQRKGPKA